ncbi:MAG TPA: hypothetical protein ENJ45_06240 [Phaeodactylibacter sp.]|nr:hypothetical protein [Phaeodactylibacter sp.]
MSGKWIFFYKIETEEGEAFILHLEFQMKLGEELIYRVGEYHGMALRRHKMKIEHFVICLGEKQAKISTQLSEEQVFI